MQSCVELSEAGGYSLGNIVLGGVTVKVWMVKGRRVLSDEDIDKLRPRVDEMGPEEHLTLWTLLLEGEEVFSLYVKPLRSGIVSDTR